MSPFIGQSSSRAHLPGLSDPSPIGNLATPTSPAAAERAKRGAASASREAGATTPAVEPEKFSPALAPLRDLAAAHAATQSVRSSLLRQPAAALLASSKLSPPSVLTLLS